MAEDVQLKLQYSCSTTESGVVWGAISDWASPILAYLLFIAAEAVPGICGLVAALERFGLLRLTWLLLPASQIQLPVPGQMIKTAAGWQATEAAFTQRTQHPFVQHQQQSLPAMPASISFTNAWLGGLPFLACCTHGPVCSAHGRAHAKLAQPEQTTAGGARCRQAAMPGFKLCSHASRTPCSHENSESPSASKAQATVL